MITNDFNARATKLLLLALFTTVSLCRQASAQVADGDRHYALRGAGASGAHATAENIDAAIAAYQRAVAQNPADFVAHGRLLRAWRFKGAYVARSVEEKRKVYAQAKLAGDQALASLGRTLSGRGTKPDGPEKSVAATARSIAGAADVYLWDAINWGEWALAYGKLAAARQGAADRIRREATIAELIDPALESGAPSRVLGRLHDQTPHIPFITGWASSKEALRFLSESLRHDPSNKLTLVFLAEAMVSNDSSTKPKAVAMLKKAATAPGDPDYPVEEAAAMEDAKALLRKWGA